MNNRILLIEKDPALIEVVSYLLDQEGYEVILSDKPFDIEQVIYLLPSIIILHNGLDNAGVRICQSLKECNDTKDIPVIMTSTHPDLSEIADKCGADAQILKPFDISHLIDLIKATVLAHNN